MAKAEFSAGDFLTRWLVALALVMVTFNPTPWSYANWLLADRPGDNLPLKALVGVVLLIIYVIFLRSTWRAIGPVGLFLSALFFGVLLWVLIDYGWLDPHRANLMTWIIHGGGRDRARDRHVLVAHPPPDVRPVRRRPRRRGLTASLGVPPGPLRWQLSQNCHRTVTEPSSNDQAVCCRLHTQPGSQE
jgi:hypothetical protein